MRPFVLKYAVLLVSRETHLASQSYPSSLSQLAYSSTSRESTLPEGLLPKILYYHFRCGHTVPLGKTRPNGRPCIHPRQSSNRRSSRADVLLVCKRWLRVGTPLLYESVHLETPAHVRQLLSLLRAHPSIGLAICRLYTTSVYEAAFEEIATLAPNIETLYLSSLAGSTFPPPPAGAAKALSRFNPTHLLICGISRQPPDVQCVLAEVMGKWSALVSNCMAILRDEIY